MALGSISQGAHQVLKITTTAGDDAFLVTRMTGSEYLSHLPEFHVEMVGKLDAITGNPEYVDVHSLIGTQANVTLNVNNDPREFNGYIAKLQRRGRRGRYEVYVATLRPWLWFATHTRDSWVFQNQSLQDILKAVFNVYSTDFEFKPASIGSTPVLEYCVQYQETDFAFVSRLMEEAGFYYFFTHTDTAHTMVITNDMSQHAERSGKIGWSNTLDNDAAFIDWAVDAEARSVKAVVWDYDYLASTTAINGEKAATSPDATEGPAEIYDHFPGTGVVMNQVKPEAQTSPTAASQAAKRAEVLIGEATSMRATATATTNVRNLAAGMKFEIEQTPHDQDAGKYLVVGAEYRIEFAQHEGISELRLGRRPDGFRADVVAIKADGNPFFPEQRTPRPSIRGPQTAVVVGASGNEIETDKHGRVKVQFHWDRQGVKDEKSSCYLRVAQPSAGKTFGFWAVPRVGQEVVVSFLEGNPDRPIVTGAVYNDQNTIAYKLPDFAMLSGMRSMSTKEGTKDTFNELRFGDDKGHEYIYIQAQKDFYRRVIENAFDLVEKNSDFQVKLTRQEKVGENWFVNVGKDVMNEFGKDLHTKVTGDVFLTGAATYQLKIAKDISVNSGAQVGVESTEDMQFKSGGKLLQESSDKLSLKAGGDFLAAGANVHVKGNSNVTIEAGSTLTLVAGGSTIVLGSSGVAISGSKVSIDGNPVAINGGGGGGGAATAADSASPTAPEEAKTDEPISDGKKSDYIKLFQDPLATDSGGSTELQA